MQVVVSQKSGKVLCVYAATGSCHHVFQLFRQSRLPIGTRAESVGGQWLSGHQKI